MNKGRKDKKIAVITGASRGIGYATVELLSLHGFKIYACVRSLKSCKNLQNLADQNSNIEILDLDLRNKSSIERVAKEIRKNEDKIDVIINNAGAIIFGPIETVGPEQFHEQFQVNLFGPILLTQELIPLMRKEKKGHIIFLGSTSGIKSHGMYGAYAASKFALEAIAHSLAVNLHPWNIHVSIIELSATNTQFENKVIKLGSRVKDSDNPYLTYTKNSLRFLQMLIMNGALPLEIAEAILKVILKPPNELRYFATKKSKDIFENSLKDPANIDWQQEVVESSNFYS